MLRNNNNVHIKDVAREAGYSIATVSKVLNGNGSISEETIRKIKAVAEKLNYTPNVAAKMLKSRKTENIGLMFYPSFTNLFSNPFYSLVVAGAEEVFSRENYNLLVAGCAITEHFNQLPKFIRERNIDGLLLIGSIPREFVERLMVIDLPFVLLDHEFNDLPGDYIVSDNFTGAKKAVEYLIRNHHTDIVMMTAMDEDTSTRKRLEGYMAALQQHEIPFRNEYVIRERHWHEGGVAAAEMLIKKELDFTAIFAVNDSMAIGAIQYFQQHGIHIPRDISMIGFDDIVVSELVTPGLTTMKVDTINMGRLGATTLMNKLKNSNEPACRKVLPVQLVERKSVKKPVERLAYK